MSIGCRFSTLGFGFLIALVSASGAIAQGPPPQLVRLDAVRIETVEQRREVTGEVRAVRRSSVAAEEAGLVMTLDVEVGELVEKGQKLATLHDRLLALELEQRVAQERSRLGDVNEEKAKLEKAERDVSRVEELMKRSGASQTELDDARTSMKEAQARVARAEADLVRAEAERKWAAQRVADMVISAPFAGAIVAKGTEVGQWVREGDTVVELVAVDEVDVYLDVPERFVEALSSSTAELELRFSALKDSLITKDFSVIAMGDRLARTFPVRVRLANADGRLKPGMSAIGMAPTGSPVEAITVHKDAVMRNDVGSFVWFDAGGVAAVAPTEVMFAVGDRVVVRSPQLKAGMRVLVEGNERVFPGQPLMEMGGASAQGGQ